MHQPNEEVIYMHNPFVMGCVPHIQQRINLGLKGQLGHLTAPGPDLTKDEPQAMGGCVWFV